MITQKFEIRALAQKVLAVLVINCCSETGEWYDCTAYIDAVGGENHENEYLRVAKVGSKIPPNIAFEIFPHIKEKMCHYRY